MTHLSEADKGAMTAGAGSLAKALLARFEGLVSPRILSFDERAAQGSAIAAFVALGLAAALVSPFAGLAGIGMRAVVLPTIVAGICLALAGYLASSGRMETVLQLAISALAGLLALAAGFGGGVASPLLLLLLAAPLEAAVAGRRTLSAYACGIACLAFGSVALAEATGAMVPAHFAFDGTLTVAIGIAYAALQTVRLTRARAAGRASRDIESAEARLIEDTLSDAVLRFAPDGRLVSSSRAARTLFGAEKAPLTEASLFQRLHVTDRVRYLQAFGELRAGGEATTAEIKLRGDADGFMDVLLRLIAVRGETGALLSILCLARDVTADRLRTAELTGALAEAKQSSDAKSQFLAAVSHELRTPLNAIIGFSDVLDQEFFGGFENPRQKEYVGLIRQSGEHLLAVVNGLLDISKIEAGRYELLLEPFAIEAALKASIEVMRPEAERKGLAIDLRLACGKAEIVADRRACHQILLNLLSNAVKFTETGAVTIAAEIREGSLVVGVSDTGMGIALGEIARLGQPFTQVSGGLSRRYQGTGLGLSLVKGLSELHHGAMEIASEFGRGTTVTVRIPLDCATRIADQQTSKENVVALAHARKKTQPSPQDDRRTRRTA